jgi:hypothetical protein
MGLQLGLGFTALRASGGGPAPDFAVTSIVWDTATDPDNPELRYSANRDHTLRALTSASPTPMSGPDIAAGAVLVQFTAAGDGYMSYDDSGDPPGTRYVHWSLDDGLGNVIVPDPLEYGIAVPGFTETWASYSNGNTFTQLDAAYSRSNAILSPSIITDADGTSGLACRYGVTSNAFHYMGRDDINAALALRTTERVQVLVQLRFVATSTFQKSAIGRQSGGLNTGLQSSRPAGVNALRLQAAGDVNSETNVTALLTGLADFACYWVRYEVDGVTLRGRAWLDGASEPGSWTTRTEAGAITFDNLNLIGRSGNPCLDVLGYSVGIGADAPAF